MLQLGRQGRPDAPDTTDADQPHRYPDSPSSSQSPQSPQSPQFPQFPPARHPLHQAAYQSLPASPSSPTFSSPTYPHSASSSPRAASFAASSSSSAFFSRTSPDANSNRASPPVIRTPRTSSTAGHSGHSASLPQANASPLSSRSSRKPAPSPLQASIAVSSSPTTSSASSPTSPPSTTASSGFQFPFSVSAPSPRSLAHNSHHDSDNAQSLDIPRIVTTAPESPRTAVPPHDADSAGKTYYISDSSASSADEDSQSPRPAVSSHLPNDRRTVSDSAAVTSKPPAASATTPRAEMASPATAPRAEAVASGPPRNASIDSGVSALSTGTASRKGSTDSVTSHDIPSIIKAAGSPEAVIEHLLKEKQAQFQQNAQLWRLVDKQRAMILGLNKDLERALKEKEKYRRKVKELLPAQDRQSIPPVPTNGAVAKGEDASKKPPEIVTRNIAQHAASDSIASDVLTSSPVNGTQGSPLQSPVDLTMAPYPITPPADQRATEASTSIQNLLDPVATMPRPQDHALDHFDHEAEEREAEAARKAANATKELPINFAIPPSRSLPSKPPQIPPPEVPPPAPPSPTADQQNTGQFPAPLAPPPRKPPPAPLMLREARPNPNIPIDDEVFESDSDYDSLLDVPVVGTEERGRRQTREEDDRIRQIAAWKEAEARSLSKKSNKTSTSADPATTTPSDEPPPQQQQTLTSNFPQPQVISVPASLDGVLHDGVAGQGSSAEEKPKRSFLAPLRSPGLPSSPRPTSNFPRSPMHSPPLSPRAASGFGSLSAGPLSPRAPRQPIPLPPNTPLQTPSPAPGEPPVHSSSNPLTIVKQMADPASSSTPSSPSVQSSTGSSRDSPAERTRIFKGFVTDEYPDLLLPPNALPSIDIKVASSRMKPSRASLMSLTQLEEDPVFTLAVFSRTDGGELWRVEKDSASLAKLDQRLKQCPNFTARTPDRALFSGHAPAKLDARRQALNIYVDELLNTQLDQATALELCRYLSTNTLPPNADETGLTPAEARKDAKAPKPSLGNRPFRNGYLTKRGKNFGGWKARFFVLDGPHLKYYETPGGAHLGTIKLQNAQIGKQSHQTDGSSTHSGAGSTGGNDEVDNQYRHAFLILEPKKKDPSAYTKHVLCAESDSERDQWVDALLRWIDYRDPAEENDTHPSGSGAADKTQGSAEGGRSSQGKKKLYGGGKKQQQQQRSQHHGAQPSNDSQGTLIGVGYDAMQQGELPQGAPGSRLRRMSTDSGSQPAPSVTQSPFSISAPRDVHVISDSSNWGGRNMLGGNLVPPSVDEKKARKRSFFGFGTKSRTSSEGTQETLFGESASSGQLGAGHGGGGPLRQVFGAPLAEAVRYNAPVGVPVPLPAVVYRCIQFLEDRNAIGEEGIFRLSGSNIVIKQLRERFNTEGDVNLVMDPTYYDIHAVASLLKMYLRELPTTILTRELHMQFVAVTEMTNQEEKLACLNELAQRLPQANATLLKYLVAFLIKVINHADQNKMTVRNVGIVFSPTLNIPAPVFALLLQNYEAIFDVDPEEYELPSPIAPADDHHQMHHQVHHQPSVSSMSTSTTATTDLLPPRPSTSHAGDSPHRQRLLDAARNGSAGNGLGGAGLGSYGRLNTQTPPPVSMSATMAQQLQSRSASTPTPPPLLQQQQLQQQQRTVGYEPQYLSQQQQQLPGNGSSVSLPYYDERPAYESNTGGLAPPYENAYGMRGKNRRESAIFPGSATPVMSQNYQQGARNPSGRH